MKKQTHPSIKAHLLWSALILLSLLAVCVIPLALAQSRSRGTTKRSRAASVSQMPASQLQTVTSGPSAINTITIPPAPGFPDAVLYDQYDNDLGSGIVSADRPDAPTLSAEAADNFVVPTGQTWTITEVDIRSPAGFPTPTSFAVIFYTDTGLHGQRFGRRRQPRLYHRAYYSGDP